MSLFDVQPTYEGKETDEYYTPAWIFDKLGVTFDLDVASPPGGSFVPCRRYYTKDDDGLKSPWNGLVWMNPPYSKTTVWFHRFVEHSNGIALLPFAKSRWFDDAWANPDIAILTLPYSLKFDRHGKAETISYPAGLFAIGGGLDILKQSNIGKIRM